MEDLVTVVASFLGLVVTGFEIGVLYLCFKALRKLAEIEDQD